MANAGTRRKEVVTGCATYEGEIKNRMKHGRGTLTWDDGDEFIGQFENNNKVRGTFNWKAGDSYTGEFKHSLMHGYGIYTYQNGRVYEGQWDGGFKEGKGIFTWPNQDKYEGQFHRDNCHGYGVQTYANSRVYKGEWTHNKKNGYGTMIWPTGEKTQGYWQNNLLSGTAIVTDVNGKRYAQKWKNGNRETTTRIALTRTEDEMKPLLETKEPPQWAHDSEFKLCYGCSSPFTVMNRRHHCRHCGLVFCGSCTSKKIEIPRLNFEQPERVCEECFIAIKTADPPLHVWKLHVDEDGNETDAITQRIKAAATAGGMRKTPGETPSGEKEED